MAIILNGTAPDVDARFIDENGVPYGVKHIDNKPRVSAMPYLYDIAEDNIPGHYAIREFGHNGVVAAAWETVHSASTLRTYLAAGERLQITSTDAADDGAPAGDGARTVTIFGLDDNYDLLTETVTMNGVANVLTDASFLRVTGMTVATAGVTGYNEGDITASNNADAIVLDMMEAQHNKSLAAVYTVRAGYTGYITLIMASEASLKGSEFGLWVRLFGGVWQIRKSIVLLGSSFVLPMSVPLQLPEKTDVEMRCHGILAGANVSAGFEGWFEAN